MPPRGNETFYHFRFTVFLLGTNAIVVMWWRNCEDSAATVFFYPVPSVADLMTGGYPE